MHIVMYRFFEIRITVKVMTVSFCLNSNSIHQIIKKAMLSLIHLKNQEHASFPRSLKDFKI